MNVPLSPSPVRWADPDQRIAPANSAGDRYVEIPR